MPARNISELDQFLKNWTESSNKSKQAFLQLMAQLEKHEQAELEFVPREGLTYSLRAKHPNQTARPLYAMVDVIEDDPRWVSVAFFGEMISDPEEKGDLVPEGLFGEDAYTFDLDVFDEADVAYVAARLDEAYKSGASD